MGYSNITAFIRLVTLCLPLFAGSSWAQSANNFDRFKLDAATSTGTPVNAAKNPTESVYQVDIIVFKYINLKELNPDLWQNYQPLSLDNAIRLRKPQSNTNIVTSFFSKDQNQENMGNNNYYQPLSKAKFLLTREAHELRRKKNYRLLTQLSWLQPIIVGRRARAIVIHGGKEYNDYGQLWEVTGTVKLSKSAYQYVNFKANLALTEPSDKGLQRITLKENRRILPDQLNYLDNPAFGLLVKIKSLD